jgi:hypothetical protein
MLVAYLLEGPQALLLPGEPQGHLWTTRYSRANGDYLVYRYPLLSESPMLWFWGRVVTVQVGSMPSAGWKKAKQTVPLRLAPAPILLLPERQVGAVMCVHGEPREDLGREQRAGREVAGCGTACRMGASLMACDSAPWSPQTPTAAVRKLNNGGMYVVVSELRRGCVDTKINAASPSIRCGVDIYSLTRSAVTFACEGGDISASGSRP